MFGFFKKQSKNKLDCSSASESQQHVEPVLTIPACNDVDVDLIEIRRRLETRVRDLSAQIAKKDAEANKLKDELGDTRRQLEFRAAGMDRYQAELQASYKETECVKRKVSQMKEEMIKYRQENEELKEKIARQEEEAAKAAESSSEEESDEDEEESSRGSTGRRAALEARVAELEADLAEVTREKNALLAAREALEGDRMEEVKIIQEALEAAVAEKENARARFEKDFEALRTVNSDREQQMLDDFEWKLRQVEQAAKKRVEDKAKEADKRAGEVRAELERQTAAHNRDLERLRRVEAEARELRELNHEQQRLLRVAAREHDSVMVNERVLKEEITRLNAQLEKEKSILAAVQSLNQKKMDEREHIFECRLERQKKQVTSEVEQRMRNEMSTRHAEEMLDRLRQCKEAHAQEIAQIQKQAQSKLEAAQRQVSALREQITQKEAQHQKELQSAQVNSDRDALELRRRLDKLDMSYQDKLDALVEKHASELEEAERRAGQAEMQAGQLRATLELVKEQLARDADEKVANLQHQHRQQLARQHEELSEVHAETISAIRAQHDAEIAALVKARSNGDVEVVDPRLAETLNKLRKQELIISDLTSTIREQDHALTTLTQEKRALQLQMSRENSRESSVEIREVSPPTVVTIQGLERISECTEPSRESSADGLVDVTEPPSHCTTPAISRQSSFEEFEECEEVQKFTLALPSSDVPDRNFLSSPPRGEFCISIPTTPSPESYPISKTSSNPELSNHTDSSNELQIPRTYYLSHSPDPIFPKEKLKLLKSKSFGITVPKSMHLHSRSISCPNLCNIDFNNDDDNNEVLCSELMV